VPIELAGEKRPQNGRGNWREHRLVTVLLDGSELGFATEPVDVAATKTFFRDEDAV
jgi:hypothetical protein